MRPRGLLFVALAAGALAIGVVRSDLAALFWGSSFLLATLYAALGALAMRGLLKRRRAADPSFVGVALPAGALRAGGAGEARVTASMPRRFLPGFTVRLVVRPSWQDRTLGPITLALGPGESRATAGFSAARRGAYQASVAELEVADVLGLARVVFRAPIRESVRVLPRAAPRRPTAREPGEGGDAPRYERSRRRSEELLEVREYVPGDDLRRLNWKLFAHARELFLRIGEETPPPRSRMLLVLDTARPTGALPRGRSDELLDLLVEDCAASASELLARGVELVAVGLGRQGPAAFGPEAHGALLAWLAEAWWAGPSATLELPAGRGPARAVVFSTPGSPGLGAILARLQSRRVRTALQLSELPAPPARPRWSLRGLLLLPPEARRA